VAYVTADTLTSALRALWGTADHMLKVWFVLKQMGMKLNGAPIRVTTSSPTLALQTLFSFGDPDGKFFVPFAHTPVLFTKFLTQIAI